MRRNINESFSNDVRKRDSTPLYLPIVTHVESFTFNVNTQWKIIQVCKFRNNNDRELENFSYETGAILFRSKGLS